MNRVAVNPEMLHWACERSGVPADALIRRFPKFEQWETGEVKPTLKQLEKFAKATYTPIGYLFMSEAPVEQIPMPDFRTLRNQQIARPSPNLLEMTYLCQQRQAWYREYQRTMGSEPLPFIGSVSINSPIEAAAASMRELLHFDLEARRAFSTWTDALRDFIQQADVLGVLVMCSGVVLNNNRRKLDPEEFRGFAIADELAPLIFINGADTKAAQMFTLAHELAHLWLGQTGISDSSPVVVPDNDIESWCNQVAAELLVPLAVVREEYRPDNDQDIEANRLARRFKVSTLVILRRLFDAGFLSMADYYQAYEDELVRLRTLPKGSGGDFYLTLPARVSKRFARALVGSTLEGNTLYRDAFSMLGIKKVETFRELGRSLGVSD